MYMTERCGAWQVGDDPDHGVVEFRIFFPAGFDPQVSTIRAVGDFLDQLGGTNWAPVDGVEMARQPRAGGGDFWVGQTSAPLRAGFYEYKYVVEFAGLPPRYVTDPCARYGGLSDQNSGIVVGGTSAADNAVAPLAGGRLPLTELNQYELMIDDFTAEYRGARAPLDAVVDRLDELVDLGINAILFMPWTAWKNRSFDWGYEPFQYFAVETRYANDLDQPSEKLSRLKQLVSACHQRGIHVIMDGVFNHVSRDFPYQQLYRDPQQCPFTAGPFGGSFPGLQDLDFANDCTNELVAEVCRYWMDEFGIDGIRLDNTVNYFVAGDVRGLPELLSYVEQHALDRRERNFSLSLEHIDLSAARVTNQTAATSFWDNSLYAACFDGLWNGRITSRLLGALNNRRFLADGKVPTLYLSNHDHSHAAWQSGAHDNTGAVGGWWKLQPFVVALYTSTAMPLLHNGQEFGEEHFLPEDDHNTGRRVSSRPLRWRRRYDPIGRSLTALHRRMATLRRDHPALRSAQMFPAVWEEWQTRFDPVGVGVDEERQLVIYHRWAALVGGRTENVVVVLNFGDDDQSVDVPVPTPGVWTDLLAGAFDPRESWSVDVMDDRARVPVGSHWARVLYRLN
ncbi:alpha-amylase family glycosyl hydrolase [Microlunatus panaciterrae]|uniref:1,4-alpha-glucan branching enzyme n=1 Tax=Microlunatus panaciterrae TaxID=400768 RepID=A0ABS2RG36_9ACTN|nr:alpha-amylase family glycosyl hydrolase [Microlunatus panaciterrae]MBM7797708.1 1,4-alpha-glucan branching enzyme [Microlunatus panaciterrae]